MSSDKVLSGRERALFKVFNSHLSGELCIKSSHDAKRFLEATDMLAKKKSPAFCAESIVSSQNGIETVRLVVRSDPSGGFISLIMTQLITHLSDPVVKLINDGDFLKRLLIAILSPPTFWSTLVEFHRESGFKHSSVDVFAWLCLEIVSINSQDLEVAYRDVAELMDGQMLLNSPSHPVRQLAYRVVKVLRVHSIVSTTHSGYSAGGRHDNDFSDFRVISIFPTADEVRSTEEPFLQRLDDVFEAPRESRAVTYLEWLFRLLREDMLADLREDLAVAWGQKKRARKPLCLGNMSLVGFGTNDKKRIDPFSLSLRCEEGIVFPRKVGQKARKKFLEDSKSFMKHNSLGALCRGNDIIAFGSIMRNVDMLAKDPPTVVLKFTGAVGLRRAIEAFLDEKRNELKFFVVDTATFAYEPILQRLKGIFEIPLEDVLLDPKNAPSTYEPPGQLPRLLDMLKKILKEGKAVNLSPIFKAVRPIRISGAQLESLINGLENSVGQIQGPPGTGKSFIGALISQIILRLTKHRILVLSYTNHALDQFLEDLLNIGVAEGDMVRLGSKSTARTAPLRLDEHTRQPRFRFSPEINAMIKRLKIEATDVSDKLTDLGGKLGAGLVAWDDILTMLEFLEDGLSYWLSFQIPETDDGFDTVGKNNRLMQPSDVLQNWARGDSDGLVPALVASMDQTCRDVWQLPLTVRAKLLEQWSSRVRQDQMAEFVELADMSHEIQRQIDSLYNETKRRVLRSKRIIGCTTTAAAMYQSIIKSAEPDVVLVEEAGEILEAHIITALSPSVKQLVLIGDHKQLRPKVNNYRLTVEKGEGFNLNVSLFERLILQGHPYTVLREQHRSHPEISYFTRYLSYEHLEDNAKTLGRDKVRGLQSRVTFVHHEHHEEQLSSVADTRDGGSRTSKRNMFEALMVIKMVRYLSQQGYKSENMVVLTPYLGQLSLLRETLSGDHDPCLNDLDSHELIRAGLIEPAIAKIYKRPLRLSTIGLSPKLRRDA